MDIKQINISEFSLRMPPKQSQILAEKINEILFHLQGQGESNAQPTQEGDCGDIELDNMMWLINSVGREVLLKKRAEALTHRVKIGHHKVIGKLLGGEVHVTVLFDGTSNSNKGDSP